MKFYHEILDEAVEEAETEGFERFMVIDKLNWQGLIYDKGTHLYVLQFEPTSIKSIEENLKIADGYKNEPFIVVTNFDAKVAPQVQ